MQAIVTIIMTAVVLLVPGGLVGLAAFYSVKEWRKRKRERLQSDQ